MTAPPAADAGLAPRVRSGALWGAANVAASRVLTFVSTIIVARLVAPEHFGVLAIAIVVQTIALNAAELGVTASLARGDRDPAELAPTVWTISLANSAGLTAAMVLGAPWLAGVLGDPAAAPVIQVLALTVLLTGVSSVSTALIWRDFHQRRRILVDLANIIVSLALVIPMAQAGWGAYALAWSRVGGQLVATAGYLIVSPTRHRPGFDRRVARDVLRMGLPLAAANLVVFATLNIDYVVIGRTLGAVELGLYLLAFNLASLPSSVFTAIIRTVAVPTFGRLFTAGRLAPAIPLVVEGIALVSFPVCALLAALAQPLVTGVYGGPWSGAAAAMLGLAVFAAARVLAEVFADLSVGAGRTVGLFWVQVAWCAALAPAMALGVARWGLAGAGLAHAVVAVAVVVPLYVLVLRRAVATPVSPLVRAVAPALAGSVACGLAAAWTAGLVESPLLAAVLGGLAGLAVHVGLTAPWWTTLPRRARAAGRADEPPQPGADPGRRDAQARTTRGPDASPGSNVEEVVA
ncbi:oligosaccharide flippase family protein [Cellulomonas cellasea]|uniref:oligosaccharide flippase family protein n=1 Tax=Cellulomonas cellasea TaxID=43670 RepID=UPI0025A41284|nr:oligosaccharide flippase family protein [Cellulomonas cellasea]MDM8083235.1 oligosaccharide flippase family protein [Cellulomonas cellasea]